MSADYGLVFPFVCCASNGGPFDDLAFVAGVRFGIAMETLRGGPMIWHDYVYPAMRDQYDLLAMHSGYSAAFGEEADGWVLCTMVKDVAP